MRNVTTVTEPAAEPVTLADVYKQLRLTVVVDDNSPSEVPATIDSLLQGNIVSARQDVESQLRRTLVQRTLRAWYPRFPRCAAEHLWLYLPPVASVTAVRYYDPDNVLVTLDEANYYVTDDFLREVRLVTGLPPPETYDRPDAVRIDYVAGYSPSGSPASTQAEWAANVPQVFKDAILLTIELLQGDLAAADSERVRVARDRLLHPHVVHLTP